MSRGAAGGPETAPRRHPGATAGAGGRSCFERAECRHSGSIRQGVRVAAAATTAENRSMLSQLPLAAVRPLRRRRQPRRARRSSAISSSSTPWLPVADAGRRRASSTAERSGPAAPVICREAVLESPSSGWPATSSCCARAARDRVRGQSRRIHHVLRRGAGAQHDPVLDRHAARPPAGLRRGARFVPGQSGASMQLPGSGVVLGGRALEARTPQPDGLAAARPDCCKDADSPWRWRTASTGRHFDALAPHADYFVVHTARHSPAEITRLAERG
ncbi:MAG: hypothetical protein MZW92_64190 [Comamonadaceae bacterium]|nr:hypothetical protein [Comamonadaceae bacterium]